MKCINKNCNRFKNEALGYLSWKNNNITGISYIICEVNECPNFIPMTKKITKEPTKPVTTHPLQYIELE